MNMLEKIKAYLPFEMALLSCERYTELASKAQDAPLNWSEKPMFYFHHVICMVCRRFRRQLCAIDEASKRLIDGEHHGDCCLPDNSKERLKAALEKASKGT